MEVDEIQRSQVCKFQRISSNDNSSNPNKIGTQKANHQYLHEDGVGGGGGGGGGGVGRLCGWPSSRIVRVSRASGGKDRHSKVLTSKGLRDRRVRLSVTTAIQFYDLQDRLGYDQPSKAVEWLIKAASSSISELPSLDPSFNDCNDVASLNNNNNNININNNISVSKSSACSSTSETSKGNDVVSRSENRVKARERAREMAAKKEKEKENDVVSLNRVNNCISQNSSFTDLLTGGSATVSPNNNSPESRIHWTTTTTPMDYFFNRPPQFNITAGENYNFAPAAGESYDLNFSIASSSSSGGGGFASGFNRGTLQSNLLSVLPHHHHHNLQRFQSSTMVDGSTSTNFPFFIAPNIGSTAPEHFPATAGYGGADRKEKSKN